MKHETCQNSVLRDGEWCCKSMPCACGLTRYVRGLGDRIAVTIEHVTGGRVRPCGGCRKRKEALNRLGRKIGL